MAEDRRAAARPSRAARRRARPARLHGVRRGEAEDAGAQGPGRSPPTAQLKKQCKQEYDTLKREVMQFLIQAEWVQQEADKQDIKVSDAEVKKLVRGPEEASFPTDKALPGVPQDLGHDRGGHPLPRQARPAPDEAHAEGHQGRHARSPTRTSRSTTTRTRSASPSPSGATCCIVLTKTEAKANEAKAALDERRGLQGGRQAVLDRRGLEGAGRQAAGRGQGPAGEGARHGRLRGQEGRGRGSRQDPVRLLRLRGHEDHPGVAAVAERRPRRRSRTCCARSASRRRSTTSSRTSARATAQDPLRRRLQGRRVQERLRRTRPTPAPASGGAPQGAQQAPQVQQDAADAAALRRRSPQSPSP